jgi:hypothetical protein
VTRTLAIAAGAALLLCACARIEQGDDKRVSIVGGEFTSPEMIIAEADKHCWKYRKTAVRSINYTMTTTVFTCQ